MIKLSLLSSRSGRFFVGLIVVLFVFFQFKFWFGESGFVDHYQLKKQVEKQQIENHSLKERNRILAAEVHDLKSGTEAIEEYARLDLGYVKTNETFVQLDYLPNGVDEESVESLKKTTDASK